MWLVRSFQFRDCTSLFGPLFEFACKLLDWADESEAKVMLAIGALHLVSEAIPWNSAFLHRFFLTLIRTTYTSSRWLDDFV
jgi:hypothetical protein